MLKTLLTVSHRAAHDRARLRRPARSLRAPPDVRPRDRRCRRARLRPRRAHRNTRRDTRKNTGERPRGHSGKRAGPADDNRIGCEEEVLVLQTARPGIDAGPFCCACTGLPYTLLSRHWQRCDASMDRFLSPEGRFCVPLVTITFKTWGIP